MSKPLPASEQPALASGKFGAGWLYIKVIAAKARGNTSCGAFGTDIVDSLRF